MSSFFRTEHPRGLHSSRLPPRANVRRRLASFQGYVRRHDGSADALASRWACDRDEKRASGGDMRVRVENEMTAFGKSDMTLWRPRAPIENSSLIPDLHATDRLPLSAIADPRLPLVLVSCWNLGPRSRRTALCTTYCALLSESLRDKRRLPRCVACYDAVIFSMRSCNSHFVRCSGCMCPITRRDAAVIVLLDPFLYPNGIVQPRSIFYAYVV